MKRRILITGASGFVGRQVINSLENENVDITIVIRGEKNNLFMNNKNIKKIITTNNLFVESEKWWEDILTKIDTIIHLAWYVETKDYLQSIKNIECLQGTISIAKAAISTGVSRFIGIGTCFEYEFNNEIISTETNLKPNTPYAASKAATFLALSQLLPSQSIEFAWCRLFYLYGEGEKSERLVPYIKNKISKGETVELTSGNQIRDYLDVKEAGYLITKVALGSLQGPINICSGVPVSIRSFAEKIAEEFNQKKLLKFGARPENKTDPMYIVGDAENINKFK
jgi:dTDP-6-deoxy-L-talose 4-dehydrogenase (NAD+)